MAINQEKQHVANYKIRLVDYDPDPEIGEYIHHKCYWYKGTLEVTERYAAQLAQEKIFMGAAIFLNDVQVSYFWC